MKDLNDSTVRDTLLHEVSSDWGIIQSHAVPGPGDMPENSQLEHAPPVILETSAKALHKEGPSASLSTFMRITICISRRTNLLAALLLKVLQVFALWQLTFFSAHAIDKSFHPRMAYAKRLMLISLTLILGSSQRTTIDAQLLNPVKNYCARFDHQCERESYLRDHDVS